MKRSETTKFLSQLLEKSCFSGPGKYWAIDGSCGSMIKYCDMSAGELFGKVLWDSTIKKSDIDIYGCDANLSVGQCH